MDLTPLFEQVARLRDPETGCPWDRKQELESYGKHIRGEADELVEALAAGDLAHVCEEAGDLLWNLCFAIHLAEERGGMTRDAVLAGVLEKMHRRHPHVFGEVKADTPEAALQVFLQAKAAERKPS